METISETKSSQVEQFIMNKIQESDNKWDDRRKQPIGMVNTLEREGVHDFVFGQFNFNNEEIDDVIYNYDDGVMKLVILGRIVSFYHDLISKAT